MPSPFSILVAVIVNLLLFVIFPVLIFVGVIFLWTLWNEEEDKSLSDSAANELEAA